VSKKKKKQKKQVKLSDETVDAISNLNYLDPKYIKAAKKRHKERNS